MTLRAGTFRARATGAELGFAETGTEQVAVSFELLDEGDTITWYGYFTEKALRTTLRALRACGWQGDDLTDLSTVTDQEVQLVLAEEADPRGERRVVVKWVNDGRGGVALKHVMNDAQKRSFAERMRGGLLAMERRAGTPPAPSPQVAARPARKPMQRFDGYGPSAQPIPPPGDANEDDLPY